MGHCSYFWCLRLQEDGDERERAHGEWVKHHKTCYSDRLKDPNVLSLTKGRLRDALMTIQMYSDRVQAHRQGEPLNLTDRAIKWAGDWKLTLLNSIWEGFALCLGEVTPEQLPSRWFHHHCPFQTHAGFFFLLVFLSRILDPSKITESTHGHPTLHERDGPFLGF